MGYIYYFTQVYVLTFFHVCLVVQIYVDIIVGKFDDYAWIWTHMLLVKMCSKVFDFLLCIEIQGSIHCLTIHTHIKNDEVIRRMEEAIIKGGIRYSQKIVYFHFKLDLLRYSI